MVEGVDGTFGGPRAGGRGSRTDRDRLDVAAQAYLSAKQEGRPTRQAVMEACHVESSQAARLIRQAKDARRIKV